MHIDRKKFLALCLALAPGMVACGGSSDDAAQGAAGAFSSGNSAKAAPSTSAAPKAPASPSANAPLGKAGEFDRDSTTQLYVTAAGSDGSLAFSIALASADAPSNFSGEAAFVQGNLYRFSPTAEGNCGLQLTPASDGGYDITEFVVGNGACDLHGASGSFEGHYGKSSGTPAVATYASGDGSGPASTLKVSAAQESSVTFTLDVVGAGGKLADVDGTATGASADPSTFVYTDKSGGSACTLNLHFGATAVVVEQNGCQDQSAGLTLAGAFLKQEEDR
jgi:hypothetical protein